MVSLLKSALANTRRASRGPRWPRFRADLESLETRSLLSADSWPGLLNPQFDTEPNQTLDAAQDIGSVQRGQSAEIIGSIGTGIGRDTDVDWFRFTLEADARVQITSQPNVYEAITPVLLTLYGDQLVEFDPAVPLQHRLLGRSEADPATTGAQIDARLSAGTYFVAVSGAGNRYFYPFVADSGLPGKGTDYGVSVSVVSGRTPSGNPDQFAPDLESRRAGDDTPDTSTDLGDLAEVGRLQVSGAIGDDPYYNVRSIDPFRMNPAADVDLYHFSITSDGHYALVAEAFAGRIGSPLDPALTLFRADEAGSLQVIATNNNTLNSTESSNGQFPFFADSVLFSGLSAGDYYLAVSSSGNDVESGSDGLFDPNIAHSGINGWSVGDYVLDLLVYPDAAAPQVIATTAADGATFSQSPRNVEVQFSEFVNLQQLAYAAFLQVGDNTVSAVFVEVADGTRFFPRLQSYDTATGTARFLMLDGLPNGEAELHLSGALGLTDLAGNPLVGNDPSGDFVTRFIVADKSRVGTPAQRSNESGNDSLETAQHLGVLFPHELQTGVTVTRDAATNNGQPADTADYFQFEILQTQSYFLTRTNTGSTAAPALKVFDLDGHAVALSPLPRGQGLRGFLPAGTYVLRVGPWDAAVAGDVRYRVEIELGGVSENPTPLTNGAAPAVGIRLLSNGPLASQESQAPVVFAQRQPQAEPQIAVFPSGLLQGFHVPALGSQSITPPGATRDSELVRLFGFSDRDRLFSLIDSTLPTSPDDNRASKAELTDEELSDILNRNRSNSDDAEADSAEKPTSEATLPAEETSTDKPSDDDGSSATNAPRSEPTKTQPVSQLPTSSGRTLRRSSDESPSAEQRQPAAWSAPIALSLATTLANTLRERALRDSRRRRAVAVRRSSLLRQRDRSIQRTNLGELTQSARRSGE